MNDYESFVSSHDARNVQKLPSLNRTYDAIYRETSEATRTSPSNTVTDVADAAGNS